MELGNLINREVKFGPNMDQVGKIEAAWVGKDNTVTVVVSSLKDGSSEYMDLDEVKLVDVAIKPSTSSRPARRKLTEKIGKIMGRKDEDDNVPFSGI